MVYKYPPGPRRGARRASAASRAHLVDYPQEATEPGGFAGAVPTLPPVGTLQAATRELDRKKRRETSEAEIARLEAIIHGLDVAVLVVDASGTVVLTNDACTRMFGSATAAHLAAAADTSGKPLRPEELLAARAARGVAFTTEFTLAEADGSRRWFAARCEPVLGADGAPGGGALTIQDVTDRALYSLQNEFIARVSHELGAPLSAIVLSLRMMLRRLGKSDSLLAAELKGDGETALWEAERMRVLVGDLVDVSRLQRGRLRLRLQTEDLVPLLSRAVSLAQLGTRTQIFVLDVPESAVLVTGDAIRLEQVVVNLLGNTLRHAPMSERINVRLRAVDDTAELSVQDFGPGIPRSSLPSLFERFAKVGSEDGGGNGGLGLGLYITKELVDAHGGRIEVESEEGRGTTFTVRLPIAAADSAISCSTSRVPASPHGLTIAAASLPNRNGEELQC